MHFTALSAPDTEERENIFSSSPFFPSISSLSCAIRLTYLLHPSLAVLVHAYTLQDAPRWVVGRLSAHLVSDRTSWKPVEF